MKALLSKAPGGPDTLVLDDIDEPTPGPGDVRVRVHAVGVNFPDSLIIQDLYQVRPPRPFAPGAELAGVIDAVGDGVSGIGVGDRVIGWAGYGAMAEKLVLPAGRCIAIPAAMPFDDAAALLMTYGTSQHALKDRAKLQAGETLLVLGAAGGVGLAAVELGKAYGARVVGAVSSEEKAELARSRGADAVLVYPKGPFDGDGRRALSAQFKTAVGGEGADVIYDPVGGDYAEAALRSSGWDVRPGSLRFR
jgi:NADPH2:quinone reductase